MNATRPHNMPFAKAIGLVVGAAARVT